jgi:hypothetical protein
LTLRPLLVLGAVATTLILGGATAAVAVPPPTNHNVAEVGSISCPEPVGEQAISFNTRVRDNPIAFLEDGRVGIAKRITDATETFTLRLASDGSVIAGPMSQPVPDDGWGNVPSSRLIECDFSISFEFVGPLDAETAEFLGLDESLVGEEVVFEVALTGTVEALLGGPKG